MFFCRSINDAVAVKASIRTGGALNLPLNDPDALNLWRQTWAAASAGAIGPLPCLLKALLQLPKRPATTPAAHDVIRVLNGIAEAATTSGSSGSSTLHDLDQIIDAVANRLQGEESKVVNPGAVADSVFILAQTLRSKTCQLLPNLEDTSLMSRGANIITRVLAEVDSYAKALLVVAAAKPNNHHELHLLAAADEQSAAVARQPWLGWRQPTMRWLLEGAWAKAPDLIELYASSQEYAEALHRMMVLLTFYWGAGAVWPKCRHSQGVRGGADDKCCNEPLLAPCRASSTRHTCTERLNHGGTCGKLAAWRCPRARHPSAICGSCLGHKQRVLVGSGDHASTDVYDGVVDREMSRRDGQLYLVSRLQSRRAPKIAPNWKTSYRLKCAGLVGVCVLGSSREALTPGLKIIWAEIVPMTPAKLGVLSSGPGQDYRERANGKMALRLLRPNANGSIQQFSDPSIAAGTRVAVIDLRVFVPEVLSVLSICSDPHLSDHLDMIPFASRLFGQGAPAPTLVLTMDAGPERTVAEAMATSEIDLVRRLTPATRDRLAANIGALARRANMYGTQLEAFCQALLCSIHCTQGPPGTGKVRVHTSHTTTMLLTKSLSHLYLLLHVLFTFL